MKKMTSLKVCALLCLCSPLLSYAKDNKLINKNSCEVNFSEAVESLAFDLLIELEPITPGFAILEGPIWLDGSLIMSHIGYNVDGVSPSDRIAYRDGEVTVLQENYLSNGLTINHLGHVVAARHFDGSVTGVESGRIYAGSYNGARFNSPNDLVFSSRGDLYFTDPTYQAPTEGVLQDAALSYHVTPHGTVTAFGDGIDLPNGVMLSKDERVLYVGGTNGLFKFDVNRHGVVSDVPVQILSEDIPGGVDGMSRDECGNLFVAANGKINVVSVAEEYLGSQEIEGITNIAFGGDSGKDIYVTTLGGLPSVYRAQGQWPVSGLPY